MEGRLIFAQQWFSTGFLPAEDLHLRRFALSLSVSLVAHLLVLSLQFGDLNTHLPWLGFAAAEKKVSAPLYLNAVLRPPAPAIAVIKPTVAVGQLVPTVRETLPTASAGLTALAVDKKSTWQRPLKQAAPPKEKPLAPIAPVVVAKSEPEPEPQPEPQPEPKPVPEPKLIHKPLQDITPPDIKESVPDAQEVARQEAALREQERAKAYAAAQETARLAEEKRRIEEQVRLQEQAEQERRIEAKRLAEERRIEMAAAAAEAAKRAKMVAEAAKAASEAAAAQSGTSASIADRGNQSAGGSSTGTSLFAQNNSGGAGAASVRTPQALPRRGNLRGQNVQDIQAKFYGQGWREKLERIGAVNAPRQAGKLGIEPPIVTVSINSDGSLAGVRILKSSGDKETDEAVIRIVTLSAPFSAFPTGLRGSYDILDITHSWNFENHKLRLLE